MGGSMSRRNSREGGTSGEGARGRKGRAIGGKEGRAGAGGRALGGGRAGRGV